MKRGGTAYGFLLANSGPWSIPKPRISGSVCELRLIRVYQLSQPPELLALALRVLFTAQFGIRIREAEVCLGTLRSQMHRHLQLAHRAGLVPGFEQHPAQG